MISPFTPGLNLKVRYLRLLISMILGLAVGFSGAKASENSSPLPLAELFGGPFELVDHNGITRSDRDFRGKFMLIYFGYTNCPVICPTNLQEISVAVKELGVDAKKVQPLFISVDPARDTLDKLKDYVAKFGPQFIGLTGTDEQIRAVTKAYRTSRRKIILPDQASKEDYLVHHSTLTQLVGPDGKFLTLFPHNTNGVEMAKRMRKYLATGQS